MTGGRSRREGSASGADALAALQGDQLDLALIDLSLPGMSRWELLSAVRAQQIDVPTDDLMAAGVRTCLYKPFELDGLLACVAQHIRRR
jgi:DNA-binding response OmpR family regulator